MPIIQEHKRTKNIAEFLKCPPGPKGLFGLQKGNCLTLFITHDNL